MTGKKQFIPEEVLEKAMESFWSQGYEATSVQDLIQSMGINRGSLYDTFGDKHALFLASLDHYSQTVMAMILKQLKAPGSAKQGIINCIQSMVERAVRDPSQKGCLVTNTATELAAHDPAVAARIQNCLQGLEQAFYKTLVRAKADDELGYEGDLHTLAQYLTSSLQGLQVMSKANPNKAVLQGIADVIVASLG